MEMKPVMSSNVAAIGYEPSADPAEGGTLGVQFKTGKTYQYQGVPLSHWDAMNAAESVGKYVSQHIVKGGFEYSLID